MSIPPRASISVWLLVAFDVAVVICEGIDEGSFTCTVRDDYPLQQYQYLRERNCDRVKDAIYEYKSLTDATDPNVPQASELCSEAKWLCKDTDKDPSHEDCQKAATYAVNAWAQLMEGTQCCSLLEPPYCVQTAVTASTVAIALLFLLPILLVIGTLYDSCYPDSHNKQEKQTSEPRSKTATLPTGPTPNPMQQGQRLANDLQDYWLTKSCMRVLPNAPGFARSSASLFGGLFATFDFQEDNVKNQYEHLLSLWRSHVAMVADRQIAEHEPVDEIALLPEAIGDIHSELLDGFMRWREKFSNDETDFEQDEDSVPSLGGMAWEQLSPALVGEEVATMNKQLAEIAAYLLVWGEAGNVRFMPEVIYFITECVLAADRAPAEGFYGGSPHVAGESGTGGAFRSGLFLSQVIRPIYNTVFDEHYSSVTVNANGKEGKKLHPGFDAYLPRDTANYDDWDELFWDPDRLSQTLVVNDGSPFFEHPPGERYSQLMDVDWAASLDSNKTKTHREIHSLWGVYATTHRVILVHLVLFALSLFVVTERNAYFEREVALESGTVLSGGMFAAVRFATLSLLIPIHGLVVAFSHWHVMGRPIRSTSYCRIGFSFLIWFVPIGLYIALRFAEKAGNDLKPFLIPFYVSVALGLIYLLFNPFGYGQRMQYFRLWEPTAVPCRTTLIRWGFWIFVFGAKFLFSLTVTETILNATRDLEVARPWRESFTELSSVFMSVEWTADVLKWLAIWVVTFLLFCADTQLWFMVGCSILGSFVALVQRRCNCLSVACEDAISKIPERFTSKILTYAASEEDVQIEDDEKTATFSSQFPLIWDRIIDYMRYEDKCDVAGQSNFAFSAEPTAVRWETLQSERLQLKDSSSGSFNVTVPEIFRNRPLCQRAMQHYCCLNDKASEWPTNVDMQWRLLALSRGLALPMPRPYRAPYIPGITVLIPHYGEDIILDKKVLFDPKSEEVPLMDWLATRYEDEFTNFTTRQQALMGGSWPQSGSQWSAYSDAQWEKVCLWASMRMQTLWRTVAGMILYYPALEALYDLQADRSSSLSQPGVWDAVDCFTCMVSMQMYRYFNKTQLHHTNLMFAKFPKCFQVAFIDYDDMGPNKDFDNMHKNQKRRYWSCLINGACPEYTDKDGKVWRQPRLRVELPGFPILGDGKGDNQNHAIPFMRGAYSQCIDANQGAYLEQMLMLPNVLAEFRTKEMGDGGGKRIIGLPEHITSDIGSVGDFAASAERSFGTLLQRTYAVLGARMHYGHPDIMNKQYMMQQGGVSKATKTLNLSEDIFAGMDFTLRGEGRTISHCEYFHLAKGRDLGFNSVLGFFMKISSGAGEQVISRQMFRLGNLLGLPEVLTFWYAHVGYYMTQFFVSAGLPLLVFIWLLVIVSDCEASFPAFGHCVMNKVGVSGAEVMARALSTWFSALMFFFIFATNAPLFAEVWYEHSFKTALFRFIKQQLTLSPLLFVFQAKIIGFYVMNELRYGGATYVATGRGLPTTRRPFIGKCKKAACELEGDASGLYLDYAAIAHYDGLRLLAGTILVRVVGGVVNAGDFGSRLWFFWLSVGLTITSWLFAPFIFNPYQFDCEPFIGDVRAWFAFFWESSGQNWVKWWEKTQLKAGVTNQKFEKFFLDVSILFAFFFFAAWFAALNLKMYVVSTVVSEDIYMKALPVTCVLPPVLSSIIYVAFVTCIDQAMSKKAPAESEDSDSGSAADASSTKSCPPGVSAIVVTILLNAESVLSLWPLLRLQWYNTFVGAMILKYFLAEIVITLGENLMRSHLFIPRKEACCARVVTKFVWANRMFRDLMASSLILLGLAPVVLLTAINKGLCPGCDWHQLLVYRDTGHAPRQEKVVFVKGDEESATQPLTMANTRSVSLAPVQAAPLTSARQPFLTPTTAQPVPTSYRAARPVM